MNTPTTDETHVIIDTRTGLAVGKPYKSRSKALARADKLDNTYGAYRYTVRSVTR